MRIRALLAVFVFLIALAAAASPAAAHHRDGHTGGPGSVEDSEGEAAREEESDEGPYGDTDRTRDEGHGDEGEEANQGLGAAVTLAVIAGGVLLIAGLGLKPGGSTPAHE